MTVAVGVLLFCAAVIHLEAATITVTNTNDSGSRAITSGIYSEGYDEPVVVGKKFS